MDYADPIFDAIRQTDHDDPYWFDGLLGAPNIPEQYQRRGLSHVETPDQQQSDITLDDVPALFLREAQAYMDIADPGYPLIFVLPAGAGKTYNAVRFAEHIASGGRRVLFCGPRRDFIHDIMAEAQQPSWWYPWQARHTGDLEAIPLIQGTCRWAPQIEQWMQRGYDSLSFCSNPRLCGWTYMAETCGYHRQRTRTEPIIFGQHAHVALGHPLMDTFSLVIGDELPLNAFIHPWRIPKKAIAPDEIVNPDIDRLLRNMRFLCDHLPDTKTWQGPELYAALPGGACGVQQTLEQHSELLAGLLQPPDLRVAEGVETAPYNHMLPLLNMMLRESRRVADGLSIIPRIILDEAGLVIRQRRKGANLPKHVIWLDATGDAHIYRQLFDMFPKAPKIINPHIRHKGTIRQLWHSTNNRSSMEAPNASKRSAVKDQIAYIVNKHGYKNPASISYKYIADSLLPGQPYAHFGSARGTNRLQSCDALFVVGSPMPGLGDIQSIGSMVYDKRDTPWIGTWHARDVPFVGQPAAYTVGNFWDDPDLVAIVRQQREAELIQAIHRVRPLRREVDVWLLTNIATSQHIDALISLPELIGAITPDGEIVRGIELHTLMQLSLIEEPITSTLLMERYHVTRKTAIKWIDAMLSTGNYRVVMIPVPGTKPIRAITKCT